MPRDCRKAARIACAALLRNPDHERFWIISAPIIRVLVRVPGLIGQSSSTTLTNWARTPVHRMEKAAGVARRISGTAWTWSGSGQGHSCRCPRLAGSDLELIAEFGCPISGGRTRTTYWQLPSNRG